MTFLAPWLLWGLPVALLPIVVHLLNLRRHRRVDWGAMQFLLQATRQRKGHTRLRHLLILCLRVLAVAALLFVISRPMAGRWFGLFGGRPETVIVVLDRSASMAEQHIQTGQSKRSAALQQLSTAIRRAGLPRQLVFIESCGTTPQVLSTPEALLELPEAGATDAAANLPGMLQLALDYIVANRSGRTDVWICSDLQASDWHADGGQWAGLRGGFKELKQPLRFHLLSYSQRDDNNLSVRVTRLERRQAAENDQLVIDVVIRALTPAPAARTVPVAIVVDGARSVVELELIGDVAELTDYVLPIDRQRQQGWGKVELPNDANPRDNAYFFSYGPSTAKRAVVVSDEPGSTWPLRLAVAPPQTERAAESQVVATADLASLDFDQVALVLWQAPLPEGPLQRNLQQYVDAGGQVVFLPVAADDSASFVGHRWGNWEKLAAEPTQAVDKWRDDAGLLAHVDAGDPLPVNQLEVRDYRQIEGPGQVLARLHSGAPLLVQVPTDRGGIHWLATLPQDPYSNLARQGIVFFSLIQRALNAGAKRTLANQFGEIELGRRGVVTDGWQHLDGWPEGRMSTEQAHVAGIYQMGERLVARNRPQIEDSAGTLASPQLDQLFAGLNYRLVEDSVTRGRSLVAEIWRIFVMLLLLALLGESILCLPDVRPKKRMAA